VAEEVAEVQKLLQASGLTYTMHSAGTTVGMCAVISVFRGRAEAIVAGYYLKNRLID
jgi:uncharacterized protein YqgV (UPF0045/DUF77 family)